MSVLAKKALVLGAGGFIGGHLVEYLVSKGYWVRGVDIKNYDYRPSVAHEFVICDLREITNTSNVFTVQGNFDHVYQLAADMGGATYINSGLNDADVMSNSVIINANVLKCCVNHNVGRLFFASSACVYSAVNDCATCKEKDVYPAFPDNEYGWEKIFSERMFTAMKKQYGIDVRIARFHSIIGEYSTWCGGKEKAHSALARKVAELESCEGTIDVIGDGTQTRTFLYVKDCVQAVYALMMSDVETVINIGSSHLVSIKEYIELLEKISNKKIAIHFTNGPTGVLNRHCDTCLATELIGWSPEYSLEYATRITYNWIKSILNHESHTTDLV